ncbi:hypothetical protein NA56DRAFT_671064 [Hyaloscypha hepaticicola]|uniref:Uncharacterized protein n=1 Tax=Hyaloscypha hepaticicola TaxID=2082293 RepID=A0A2J6Q3B4_9HELO|nr:hypothetical protein NA56DRAFT_671064 [Hyaloscypha hepaticicola]
MAGKAHNSLNVFKKPLYLFSKEPMTGFYRNGYCDVGEEDGGNHSLLSRMIFLDFTASRGNDLRGIGLRAGCKWCLCASRWKEALDYANQQGKESDSVVPKVHLHATSERALNVVDIKDLKRYAAESEVGNASNVAQSRKGGKIRDRTELAEKGEMTGR